ncbi:hypothetical protein WME88_18625 [Sorangium sp. So ce216]
MSRRPSSPLLAAALLAASCGPSSSGSPPAPASPAAPIASASGVPAEPPPPAPEDARVARLGRLVEASIIATHAHHILLARRGGKGDVACYGAGARPDGDLDALVEHQRALFSTGPAALKAWADGQPAGADAGRRVDALLAAGLTIPERTPVQVITAYLRRTARAPPQHLCAIANLWQIVLEVDRDGDILQQVFDAYIALGLPVYAGQLELPGSDADLLALGKDLAPRVCPSPYDTTPEAFQISGRKLSSWAERKLHIRDAALIAGERLAEPAIKAIVPELRVLPPQKIAVVGHSFTLELHWASPGTFVQIAGAVIARENPKIELRQWAAGGLTASKAEKQYLHELIA